MNKFILCMNRFALIHIVVAAYVNQSALSHFNLKKLGFSYEKSGFFITKNPLF